jgi:sugar diacid utilization regulator
MNSFEAEQHLRFFGICDSPVCWMFEGYAGGYGSCYLGEQVIYKEIKCVGKGDPYCEHVGKTLKEWGDEISSELPYYEETKINEELEVANKIIQHKNLQLQKAFDVLEQLTHLVAIGEGLKGITKTLSEMINGTILVFDNKIQTLVTYACAGMSYVTLQKEISEFLRNLMSSPIKRQEFDGLIAKKTPIWVDFKIQKEVYPCAFAPIAVKDELLGFIVAIPSNRTKQDFIMAIQHSAGVYAFELNKQKTIADLEQQFRGNFLDSLISENTSDEEMLKVWAFRLGYDISAAHNIIVMGVDYSITKGHNSEEITINSKDSFLEFINHFITIRCQSILYGQVKNMMVFLLPGDNMADRKNINDFITQLRTTTNRNFPRISVFFGVGRVITELSDYPKSYHQAVRALEIVRLFNKINGVVFYDDLGSLALLFGVNNKTELLYFMEKTLGPLIQYDNKYNGELLKTLEQYLDNNSIQETSKETALSVSGIKYRLNKIKELGYDLHSQQGKFDLRIALNIWKIKQIV